MRQIPASLPDLPRDQPILVLCHVGARSLRVAQFLRASGFTGMSSGVEPNLTGFGKNFLE